MRHADEPAKFMESEIELFEELNKLQALATVPELYTEFVKLHGVSKVCSSLRPLVFPFSPTQLQHAVNLPSSAAKCILPVHICL